MPYTLAKSTGDFLVVVPDNSVDSTTTSISLLGQNVFDFGLHTDLNFVDILQNFADNHSPVNPLIGQLWFDRSTNSLRLFNGSAWSTSLSSVSGTTGTIITPVADADNSATIVTTLLDSVIGSVVSRLEMLSGSIPSNLIVNSNNIELNSAFLNGIMPGINLPTYNDIPGRLNGNATSTDKLTTTYLISLTGAATGNIGFDGSSDVVISTAINNVYIGNSNVTVGGVHNIITVNDAGLVTDGSDFTISDIVINALGYKPYSAADASTDAIPDTLVERDINGNFSANVMTGLSIYTNSFTSNIAISMSGDAVGTGYTDGTANAVIQSNLISTSSLEGIYNNVTVNSNGFVVAGTLTEDIPVGSIILYNNVVLPAGWVPCNGSNVSVGQDGTIINTPNLVLSSVGSAYYIIKTTSDIDLPTNNPQVGSIMVNLVGGDVPSVSFINGVEISYPPLVYSDLDSGGNNVSDNTYVIVSNVTITSGSANYVIGDILNVDLPTFDPVKSSPATVTVTSVDSDGSITDYTISHPGQYYITPSQGYYGIWFNPSTPNRTTSQEYTYYAPDGSVVKSTFDVTPYNVDNAWQGLEGLSNHPAIGGHGSGALFSTELNAINVNSYPVSDVDFGGDDYFDAVALVLTNGDLNAVMLSQTNLFGDLSHLTIMQILRTLENRIISGLPARVGKYMLSYNDILHHAGTLKCPVDITYFTVAVQNQLMLLTTTENANKMSAMGIYPGDEKLFGAAYIGLDPYIAIHSSPYNMPVYLAFYINNIQPTGIPNIDNLTCGEFLKYCSKMITDAKTAIANNKVARAIAIQWNTYYGFGNVDSQGNIIPVTPATPDKKTDKHKKPTSPNKDKDSYKFNTTVSTSKVYADTTYNSLQSGGSPRSDTTFSSVSVRS
jgi:hypothetical protein